MDEENVAPQNDEKDVAPEQTNEVQEQPAQEPEVASKEQPEEPVKESTPEESVEDKKPTAEETDADTLGYYNDYLNRAGNQGLPELQFGEDGTIDVNELNNWAKGIVQNAQYQSAKQFADLREEDRQWNKVFDKFPEVRENKKLRDLVHKQRMGNIAGGGKNDVMKAAQDIFALRSEGVNTGRKSAQESITRQRTADLETASTPTDNSTGRREELSILMTSRSKRVSEGARQQLLKEMIERGEL